MTAHPHHRTKPRRPYCILGLLGALSLLSGCPTPWREAHYAAGTLGAELNPKFQTHVENCKIFESSSAELLPGFDYIPAELWSGVGSEARDAKATVISSVSSRLLFLFPFTAEEAEAITTLSPDYVGVRATRALKEDDLSPIGDVNSGAVSPLPAAGATLYRQSCSSYLKSAANAGVKLGVARMESAIKAEFESHSNVLLMHGTFESPLHQALTSPGAARRYGRLLFWTRYYRDEAVSAQVPKYLKSVRGVAFARTAISSRDTTFHGVGTGSGGVSVFNAEMNVAAGFGEGSNLDTNSIALFLLGADKETAQFELGPTRDEIIRELQSALDAAARVTPPISPSLTEHVQQLHMTGIPKSLCAEGIWEVRPDDAALKLYEQTPALRPIDGGVDKAGIPQCTFELRAKPLRQSADSAGAIQPNKTVNVTYEVAGLGADAPLKATISNTIEILSGPYPDAPLDPVRVKREDVNGRVRPSWSFQVRIADPNGLLAPNMQPKLIEAAKKITCGDGDDAEVRVKVSQGADPSVVDVDVTGEVDYSPNQALETFASRACTLTLRIRVGLIDKGATASPGKQAPPEHVTDYFIPISAKLSNPFTRALQP